MAEHDLKRLFQVQGIEQRLRQLERTRANAPETALVKELKDRAGKIRKLEAVLDKRIAVARRGVRKRELALASAEEAKTSVEGQLYGGEVTNPKELTQLEKRLVELNAQVEAEETALLQALEALEDLEAQQRKVEAADAKNESQLKTALQRLEHLESTWDLEEAMLLGEMEEIRAQIDESSLALYEKKKAVTAGTPIALVSRGVCGGCRMALPASVAALRGAVTSTCEHCGRLLYWPD